MINKQTEMSDYEMKQNSHSSNTKYTRHKRLHSSRGNISTSYSPDLIPIFNKKMKLDQDNYLVVTNPKSLGATTNIVPITNIIGNPNHFQVNSPNHGLNQFGLDVEMKPYPSQSIRSENKIPERIREKMSKYKSDLYSTEYGSKFEQCGGYPCTKM